MSIKVGDLLELIDKWAPFSLAEEWDNVGLQIGSKEKEVKRIGILLDFTEQDFDWIEEKDIQVLITHHPLWLSPLYTINKDNFLGKLIYKAIQRDLSIIVAHTNLDITWGGVNDVLAEALGLKVEGILGSSVVVEGRVYGQGRVACLFQKLSLKELLEKVVSVLHTRSLFYSGNLNHKVKKIGLCAGAGGSLLTQALEKGVDVYITGEMGYHKWREAEAYGLSVIMAGHFETEYLIVPKIKDYLLQWSKEKGYDIEVFYKRNDLSWQGFYI